MEFSTHFFWEKSCRSWRDTPPGPRTPMPQSCEHWPQADQEDISQPGRHGMAINLVMGWPEPFSSLGNNDGVNVNGFWMTSHFFEMEKKKSLKPPDQSYICELLWTSWGYFTLRRQWTFRKSTESPKKLIGLNKKNNCHICCTNTQQWSYKGSLNKSTYKGVCDLIIHITAVNIHITAGFPYHKSGKKVGLISEGLITTFGGEFLFSWSSHI